MSSVSAGPVQAARILRGWPSMQGFMHRTVRARTYPSEGESLGGQPVERRCPHHRVVIRQPEVWPQVIRHQHQHVLRTGRCGLRRRRRRRGGRHRTVEEARDVSRGGVVGLERAALDVAAAAAGRGGRPTFRRRHPGGVDEEAGVGPGRRQRAAPGQRAHRYRRYLGCAGKVVVAVYHRRRAALRRRRRRRRRRDGRRDRSFQFQQRQQRQQQQQPQSCRRPHLVTPDRRPSNVGSKPLASKIPSPLPPSIAVEPSPGPASCRLTSSKVVSQK